jgi:putative Mg2+ transporter-C (MgtC) family protein
MDWLDIALRLTAATLIGMAIGFNRDLHGKATGMRTLGLVGLGSALAVTAITFATLPDREGMHAVSRVIQGILTGIGFIGAGVIVRDDPQRVRGLTTAACAWLTACIGVVCAVAGWKVVVIGSVLTGFVLLVGGPLEKRLHTLWMGEEEETSPGEKRSQTEK